MASVNLPRLPTWLVQACDVMFSFPGCSPLQHLAEDRGAMASVGLPGRSPFDKDHGHLFRILNLARTLLGTLLLLLLIQRSAMPEPVPQFTNITRSSGVTFLHLNGAEKKKPYLFEAKGGGAGFFDFDKDGWLDLLMVQGSTLERFRKGDNPHCSLYQNQRDGTFADRTKEAGLTSPHFSVRHGKASSSNGCETRPTTVAPVGSSQGGSWRQRYGLKHSGVKGPLWAVQRTCGPERE